MRSNLPSELEWNEWQSNPITEWAAAQVKEMADRQREAALAAYWAGSPWAESQREALRQMELWHENFFECDLADMIAINGAEE